MIHCCGCCRRRCPLGWCLIDCRILSVRVFVPSTFDSSLHLPVYIWSHQPGSHMFFFFPSKFSLAPHLPPPSAMLAFKCSREKDSAVPFPRRSITDNRIAFSDLVLSKSFASETAVVHETCTGGLIGLEVCYEASDQHCRSLSISTECKYR